MSGRDVSIMNLQVRYIFFLISFTENYFYEVLTVSLRYGTLDIIGQNKHFHKAHFGLKVSIAPLPNPVLLKLEVVTIFRGCRAVQQICNIFHDIQKREEFLQQSVHSPLCTRLSSLPVTRQFSFLSRDQLDSKNKSVKLPVHFRQITETVYRCLIFQSQITVK